MLLNPAISGSLIWIYFLVALPLAFLSRSDGLGPGPSISHDIGPVLAGLANLGTEMKSQVTGIASIEWWCAYTTPYYAHAVGRRHISIPLETNPPITVLTQDQTTVSIIP